MGFEGVRSVNFGGMKRLFQAIPSRRVWKYVSYECSGLYIYLPADRNESSGQIFQLKSRRQWRQQEYALA